MSSRNLENVSGTRLPTFVGSSKLKMSFISVVYASVGDESG